MSHQSRERLAARWLSRLFLCGVLCSVAACGDEKDKHHDVVDAGPDAGGDAGVQKSALPRPALERPPSSLPADLRPPR
ncbi:MAG: hypothetical protein QM778_29555 [Myxococcales bacterium]